MNELTEKPLELLTEEEAGRFLDELTVEMLQREDTYELPLVHRFTPDLYSRQCLMFAGSYVISKIHKTQHQFVILSGKIIVWERGKKPQLYKAPFHGITEPGTQRLLFALEHTVWTTFHSTIHQTVEEIEANIIEKRINPFLLKGVTN